MVMEYDGGKGPQDCEETGNIIQSDCLKEEDKPKHGFHTQMPTESGIH